MKKTTKIKFAVVAALTAAYTGSASAATIIYNDFSHAGSDAIDYIVTVDDDSSAGVTANHFKVSYQVAPASAFTVGKLTGFFFDITGSSYNAGNLNLVNDSPASCGQGFGTDQVVAGGGCNSTLNLGAVAGPMQDHQFDVGIAWQNNNDLSGGATGMFEVADQGLSLADWGAVALRGQDTSGPGGSAKDFATTFVPIPAAAWLFGTGLMALGGMVVRKRRQAA